MALDNTGRFAIYEWGSATDPFTRDQMSESHQVLKTRAAGFVTTEESVPNTDLNGYFYYTSTDGTAGTLKYSNGVDWFAINESGTVVSLDGTTSDGTGTTFALANHKHALDDNIVTSSKINASAVTTVKINNAAVTTDKINDAAVTNVKLASGIDAAKLTTGTLPAARIASGDISNDKLASGIDASKLTTGTLPIARISANAVTVDKIEQVAGHGILARVGGTEGNLSEITASTNQVLGRGASGNLTFAQISTGQIAANQVTYAKMQNISSGYTILGKAGSGSGAVAEITAGTDSVLRRDGSNNLGFGKIDGNHISDNSITSTQIGTDAVGSSELADNAVDTAAIVDGAVSTAKIADDAVTLGTKTSGTYVKAISAGTNISTTNTDDAEGGRTVTVNHATMTTPTPSSNAQNGQAITSLTISNGHVTDYTYYDFDSRFPAKGSTYTTSTGGGYWITYSTSNPNNGDGAPNGSIYLQYS